MCIAALFAIAKIWKQLKCPLMDEWIKKMWWIYIYYINTDKEILLSKKKKKHLNLTICNNIDKSRGYYSK